ncbi:MAG: ABC transporter ATP-binding protein [Synergistaceae bacterium]|jgi:ABC-type dipeptide/oligopeptide/nickel transport system ATPase component|nr:ABC transporter ATP-binding protein [Synergistaceae bacterium]
MTCVLRVRNLQVRFAGEGRGTCPVKGVDLDMFSGETLALVGESGSGKTLTAYSIMGLLRSWNNLVKPLVSGTIDFTAKDGHSYILSDLDDEGYDQVRGKDLSIIFQEPMTAMNPVTTIGRQLAETITAHESVTKREARERALKLLREVGISNPEERADAYPHQFSGGQLQRIMIAMAISCSPTCLIADEPTTALDVAVQEQIMSLISGLKDKNNMAVLLITHDLGLVSQYADRVSVIYSGVILESGPVEEIFGRPSHPYTRLLLESVPTDATSSGMRLRTKKDFISGSGANGLLFDPEDDRPGKLEKIGQGHYMSMKFTREARI